MNKYIIKNCPARCNGMFKDCIGTSHNECQDCTDCLLKRIVEKAKNARPYNFLSDDILKMLVIEECEEWKKN